ncbi:unnamed protein product [Toxocara canis]|uniref:PDZ domain-containing protein n=1 Tax=Toxocara canis TaxID=6265 RepID=A0A183VGG8_TOXCA|nr:unnamed protein product [Toxocara canis]
MGAFDHIETVGGLEVTVLQCTRLNTSLAAVDHSEVYCTLSLEPIRAYGASAKSSGSSAFLLILECMMKLTNSLFNMLFKKGNNNRFLKQPRFLRSASASSTHCMMAVLSFVRHGLAEPLGLTFNRSVAELGLRAVQVDSVDLNSAAEKCGFLPGDVIVAVNNVPIQSAKRSFDAMHRVATICMHYSSKVRAIAFTAMAAQIAFQVCASAGWSCSTRSKACMGVNIF